MKPPHIIATSVRAYGFTLSYTRDTMAYHFIWVHTHTRDTMAYLFCAVCVAIGRGIGHDGIRDEGLVGVLRIRQDAGAPRAVQDLLDLEIGGLGIRMNKCAVIPTLLCVPSPQPSSFQEMWGRDPTSAD